MMVMLPVFTIALPPSGGGGMAQGSFFERLGPYLAFGLILVVAVGLATAVVRRLHREPEGDDDEAEEGR